MNFPPKEIEVHGKMYEVNFRYVWARPKNNSDMKYHIARQFEGDFSGNSLKGRTQFLCPIYQSSFRNTDVKVIEWYTYKEEDKLHWNQHPSYYASCMFCWNKREKFQKAVNGSKAIGKVEIAGTEVHGKMYNINFRYVWARPKGNYKLKFHVARLYEGTYDGNSMRGVVSFLCSHYGGTRKNTTVDIRDLPDPPPWSDRCEFCYSNKADYQAKINKYWLKVNTEEQQVKQATEGHMKEHTTKSDEEDIVLDSGVDLVSSPGEHKYYACQKCQSNTCKCSLGERAEPTGRNNIRPPYFECVKCLRRYAISVKYSYTPADNTGITVEEYSDFMDDKGNKKHKISEEYTKTARIYRCVCSHPIMISVGNKWTSRHGNKKVFVGRPVVK